MRAPGGTPTRTGCAPLRRKRDGQRHRHDDRKDEGPEQRLGLAHELAQPGQRQLDERMMRAAASRRYSSRRCLPVSDMNTSSSVPWCMTTLGAPSAVIELLRRAEGDDRARDRRSPRDRTAPPLRPCSAWSARSCRRSARKRSSTPHSCRRDCGSRPVVGSSRNSRSGSPASAQASDSRCFWPPDSLPTQLVALALELDEREQLVDRLPAIVERPEQAQRLLDRQLVGELRLLQLDAEALAQLALVALPAQPEHFDLARIGRQQPFEDLDRRRLPGAVRTEQPEALAALHVERQAVDGDDVAVALCAECVDSARRAKFTSHCSHCCYRAFGVRVSLPLSC